MGRLSLVVFVVCALLAGEALGRVDHCIGLQSCELCTAADVDFSCLWCYPWRGDGYCFDSTNGTWCRGSARGYMATCANVSLIVAIAVPCGVVALCVVACVVAACCCCRSRRTVYRPIGQPQQYQQQYQQQPQYQYVPSYAAPPAPFAPPTATAAGGTLLYPTIQTQQ